MIAAFAAEELRQAPPRETTAAPATAIDNVFTVFIVVFAPEKVNFESA
jgi:hypothetical protein